MKRVIIREDDKVMRIIPGNSGLSGLRFSR